MSEPPVGGDKGIIVGEIEADPSAWRWGFKLLPLPTKMLLHLGHVAINWGAFDLAVSKLLGAMVTANSTEADWQTLRGKKRRSRVLRESRLAFADCPDVIAAIKQIMDDGGSASDERNLLLHGELAVEFGPDQGAATTVRILARTVRANATVEESVFDFIRVRWLANKLASLHLQVSLLLEQPDNVPGISSLGKSRLRALGSTTRPTPASDAIQPPPPQSSEG